MAETRLIAVKEVTGGHIWISLKLEPPGFAAGLDIGAKEREASRIILRVLV